MYAIRSYYEAEITLNNCMILNSGALGIYAFNAKIIAYNTIVADSRYMSVFIQMGGRYRFYHCSLSNHSANYPSETNSYIPRESSSPTLYFTNYFKWFDLDEDYRIIPSDYPMALDLGFYNSIIYGDQKIRNNFV